LGATARGGNRKGCPYNLPWGCPCPIGGNRNGGNRDGGQPQGSPLQARGLR
jgi:hypothetical protein